MAMMGPEILKELDAIAMGFLADIGGMLLNHEIETDPNKLQAASLDTAMQAIRNLSLKMNDGRPEPFLGDIGHALAGIAIQQPDPAQVLGYVAQVTMADVEAMRADAVKAGVIATQ